MAFFKPKAALLALFADVRCQCYCEMLDAVSANDMLCVLCSPTALVLVLVFSGALLTADVPRAQWFTFLKM